MWRALAIVLCACAPRPPTAPIANRPRGCDGWSAAPESPLRAWVNTSAPATGHPQRAVRAERDPAPAIVIELDGSDVLVAAVSPSTIVTRWVPVAALGRVAIREIAVSPTPGAPGDPAVLLHPGFPLAPLTTTGDAWVAIGPSGDREGVELAGYVPAGAAGAYWEVSPPPPPRRGHGYALAGNLRTAPRDDAPIRAHVTSAHALALAAAQLPAPWGAATYYTDEAPIAPAPPVAWPEHW